jgi:hypothetical protein
VGDATRAAMKKILADIQDGTFAREWIKENKDGGNNFAKLREREQQHPIEIVGAQLRGMMSWLPGRQKKEAGCTESESEKLTEGRDPSNRSSECLREPKSFCGACAPKGWTWCSAIPAARSCRCMTRLEGSGVRHVLTRHEQGAAFAAEGYARVTGKVGVAIATSGPGATNLVTGIADAKMDSVPLVCITGQVRTPMIGTDAFQETDVFGVTLSLTKWSRLVRTIDEIPEVIAEGFHWARSGRPGPVVIDIPTDLLKARKNSPVRLSSLRTRVRPRMRSAEGAFSDTIVALLQRATKPVALVGAGAKLSGAIPELRRCSTI